MNRFWGRGGEQLGKRAGSFWPGLSVRTCAGRRGVQSGIAAQAPRAANARSDTCARARRAWHLDGDCLGDFQVAQILRRGSSARRVHLHEHCTSDNVTL